MRFFPGLAQRWSAGMKERKADYEDMRPWDELKEKHYLQNGLTKEDCRVLMLMKAEDNFSCFINLEDTYLQLGHNNK